MSRLRRATQAALGEHVCQSMCTSNVEKCENKIRPTCKRQLCWWAEMISSFPCSAAQIVVPRCIFFLVMALERRFNGKMLCRTNMPSYSKFRIKEMPRCE